MLTSALKSRTAVRSLTEINSGTAKRYKQMGLFLLDLAPMIMYDNVVSLRNVLCV